MSGVEIRVRSDSRQARRDLSQLENSVKNIETRTARATSAFRKMAIGIGAALAGGAVIKGVNRASDSLVNLENRIALVTGRGKALDKTMNDLFKIAKRTRGDIGGSAETFNRFGIALKGSGKSAEEILRAVESVNKAVAISGSGAESARAALFQLGQGLASGQLRGQELNSVLEQAPRLAGAIADELGKPLGSLRKLAEQGEITTDVVFNALINQAGKLSEEFETMEGTSEQAFSVMKDQIGRVVGEISAALNITGAFTQRFNAISDSLEKNRVSIVSGVVGSVQGIGSVFTGVKDSIGGIAAIIATAVKSLLSFVKVSKDIDLKFIDVGVLDKASKGLKNIVSFLRDAKEDTRFVERAMSKMAKAVSNAIGGLNDIKTTAMDKLARLARRASKDMEMLYTRAKLFSAVKYVEFRGGNGVIADLQMYLKVIRAQQKAEKSARELFKNTAAYATEYLSKAWKSVKAFLNLIERKFYWVYDEVIQNSWWTDTMEQTYYLAEKWLGKAADTVSKFGDTVNDKFRKVFASFKDGGKSLQSSFTIKDVKIKFSKATGNFKDLAQTVTTTVTEGLKTAFDTLGAISPVLSATFGAALVAGVTKFLSPALFKKTFARVGPLAIVALFAGLASGISAQIVDTGVFDQLGANLGTTLAVAFDAFIDLIPAGVDAAIRSLSSLGDAFGEQLQNSIIGLPAKILSFLPGGGLLTAILYGGGTFLAIGSIFSKNIRGLVVKTVASSAALSSATGVMGNILFGTLGAKRGLGVLAVTTTASIALFGDLVGTEVSSIIGVITGIMATSMLSGRGAMAALGGSFAGLRNIITTGSVQIMAAGTTAFKAISVAGVTSFRSLSAQSTISTGIMARNFQALKAKGTSALSFLSTGRGRLLGIAIGAVAASAAMTGFANASTGAADAFSQDGGIFSADKMFAAFTVASILPLVWKPLKKVGSIVGKRLGLGIAFTLLKGLGAALLAGITAIFSPFVLAFAAVAATATLGYVAIFGTEGSFMSMVTKTLTKVKRAFGLTFDNDLRVGIDTKREARGLRNRAVGGLDKSVVDQLQRIDFGGLSQKGAFKITKSVSEVSKLTEKANSERLRFGKVSAETAKKLQAAQEETTRAVREGAKNVPDSAESVETGLSGVARNLAVGIESTGFFSNLTADFKIFFERSGNNVKRFFGKATTDLERRLEFSTAVAESDLNDPEQFKKILEQFQLTQGGFDSAALPQSIQSNQLVLDTLNKIALGQQTPSDQLVQALLRAIDEGRQADKSIIGSILVATGALEKLGITSLTANQKAIQNAITAGADEGRQQRIIANVKELDNVVNALSQAGTNVADSFALINKFERKAISDLVERAKLERTLIDEAKAEQFQAENESEEIAADLKLFNANTELANVEFLLQRTIADAIKTGIDKTNFQTLTNILNDAGIDEAVAEQISKGLAIASDDTNLTSFDRNLFGRGLEKLNFGSALGNREGGASTSLKPETINTALLNLQQQKKILEELTASQDNLSEKETKRFIQTKDNIKKLTKEVELYASFIDGLEVTDSELPNLLSTVASISDIDNLDLDKFFKIEPDTQKQVALMASQIELLKNTNPGDLNLLGLGDFGADVGGREKLIAELEQGIDNILGKFGNTIRTGFLSDFEEIAQETGLSFNQISALGVKANTKIRDSIETISKAQKALNKLSVGDTEERAKQLRLIKEAEESINNQLMGGTISSVRTGLERQGVDAGLATESPEAMGIGLNIASLQRELGRLNSQDIKQRDIILGQIKQQERLLDGITDKARSSAGGIKDSFKDSLSGLLNGEISSLSDAFKPLLDSLSMGIIDTVVDSFTEAFFQTAGLDSMFENLFGSMFKFGENGGDEAGGFLSGLFGGKKKDTKQNSKEAAEPFSGVFNDFLGGLGDKFSGITESFGGIFSGLTGSLGGLFEGLGGTFSNLLGSIGGMFGGGGGGGSDLLGTALKLGGSFFGIPGFSQGGTVQSTAFSQVGKDSVPAMLMPGEVVMSKNAVRNDALNKGGSTQSFNINIQGDVSRQTRKEIVKMMPQIAGGVNAQNKENNFRG